MLMRIFLPVLLILVSTAPAYAHMPTGYMQKVSVQVGDYSLRIMVSPARPEVNRSSEIIVGIINSRANAPFNGEVRINGVPATRFSQGFYEVKYVFKDVGNTTILLEFTGQDGKLKTRITAEVVGSSGPGKLFLGGVLIVLSTLFIMVWYLRNPK